MADIDWVKLELDVSSFEPEKFLSELEQLSAAGITFTTLRDIGDTMDDRYRLYELNAECSADIPGRGEFYSWDEYQRVRLQKPSFDPAGVVLAIEGDAWVGMSGVAYRDGYDYAFADMTGTVASHRGRGIATTMKVMGIEFVCGIGIPAIRTVHHPGNTAMIDLNRRLGFRDGSWEYPIP